MRTTRGRLAIAALVVTLCSGGGLYWAAGTMLVKADRHPVRRLPATLNAETICIASPSGARLAAWVLVPPNPRAAVVVLHGVHADRAAMLSRARLLRQDGFAVLLPDLQAHGESTGDRITYGFLEARDAAACLSYMRGRLPGLRVGAIGVSLGGAALALAGPQVEPDALVLEAVFSTIGEAVENRLRMRVGALSRVLGPLLLLQLKPRLGVDPDDLRPIEAVRQLHCPLLVLAGTADHLTTEAQTRALFAAANEPKQLWLVTGAAHVDLLRFDRDGYTSRVLSFLEEHLGGRP